MGTYEYFDHTADVGVRVRGESPRDVLITAANALMDYVVVNRDAVREESVEETRLSAESPEDLLAEWLSDLIFRIETDHRLFSRFDIELDEAENQLVGRLWGERIDRDRHILDHEVKAVTRHGLSFCKEGTGWSAEFILDI